MCLLRWRSVCQLVEQAFSEGSRGRLCVRAGAHLGEDVRGMLLDGEVADVQLKPDPLVRFPGRDQMEDG